MGIRKTFCFIIVLVCTISTAASAAGSAWPAFSASENQSKNTSIPVLSGSVTELSASDIEKRLGLQYGTLEGTTFIALPHASQGFFYLDGVAIEEFDYLSRNELDRLCFAAADDMTTTTVTLMPNAYNAVTAGISLQATNTQNHPPAIESAAYNTVKNIGIKGFVNVNDPEEDSIKLQIVNTPVKGILKIEGQSFIYEPFNNMVGKDSFTLCAVDSLGNYSQNTVIEIFIEDNREKFAYADMLNNSSHYAAVKLQENGVMIGRQIGDAWFFEPSKHVSRGDFLIMLLSAANIKTQITINTGLPNDSSIPMWLKPYVKKAVETGIIPPSQDFMYHETPIRAEAVLMTNRASKITDVKEFSLAMPDIADLPEWSLESYMNLAAYKMLDLHDGKAFPTGALTNSYAADLIWQLYKHCHR